MNKLYFTALPFLMFPSLLFAGNCACKALDSNSAIIATDRTCIKPQDICYKWCDQTYNKNGLFSPAISYEEGECSANCGNIYIRENTEFKKGQDWKVCTNYKFIFQTDGNLVVYNPKGESVWNSNTVNSGAETLTMQPDGNLVIYNTQDKPIWSSDTSGNNGAVLAIKDDGDVMIYDSKDRPIWSTETKGK